MFTLIQTEVTVQNLTLHQIWTRNAPAVLSFLSTGNLPYKSIEYIKKSRVNQKQSMMEILHVGFVNPTLHGPLKLLNDHGGLSSKTLKTRPARCVDGFGPERLCTLRQF